jgi:hypothetical protein
MWTRRTRTCPCLAGGTHTRTRTMSLRDSPPRCRYGRSFATCEAASTPAAPAMTAKANAAAVRIPAAARRERRRRATSASVAPSRIHSRSARPIFQSNRRRLTVSHLGGRDDPPHPVSLARWRPRDAPRVRERHHEERGFRRRLLGGEVIVGDERLERRVKASRDRGFLESGRRGSNPRPSAWEIARARCPAGTWTRGAARSPSSGASSRPQVSCSGGVS